MKIKFSILVFAIILLPLVLKSQQLPQFSQYLFNPIYINPAFAGYKGDTFIQTYIRKQWLGSEGAPVNFGIAADGFLNDKNIGIGFHAGAETIGFQRDYTFQGKFAYHLQLSRKSYLSMGSSFGFGNQKIDTEKIDPIQAYDPLLSTKFNSIFYPELSFGLFYYNPNYFFSAALNNLFFTKSSTSNTDVIVNSKKSINASAGFVHEFMDEKSLEGSFLMLSDNRAPARFDFNLNFHMNEVFAFGVGTRNYTNFITVFKQASSFSFMEVILFTEIKLNNSLGMGYSFDYNVNYSLNSHELSLSYTIKNKNLKILSPRYF